MHALVSAAVLVSLALIATSEIPMPDPSYPLSPEHIDNPTIHDEQPTRFVPLWYGFPFAYFATVAAMFVWAKLRRELDYELERGSQPEA